MFPIPHGIACARLLPSIVELNVRALRARESTSVAIDRYDEIARIVTEDSKARAEDAAVWSRALVEDLRVPMLGTYGVRETDIPRVVAAARQASSMRGNPIVLTDDELGEAVRASI
jgi:alcohol dehydrogenase class IV